MVFTGAPGGGKTSLIDAAAAAGYRTSPEVARQILREPGGMELRQSDPLGFAERMAQAHLREYENHRGAPSLVLFDRGLPDVVGFLEVCGLGIPRSLDEACRRIRYSGPVFRAPAWKDIYRSDAQRIQSWDEAVASDQAVTQAWTRYGYEPIDLPLATIGERLAFMKSHLSDKDRA